FLNRINFYLHIGEEQRHQRLPWPVRFKVILGIARGVVYLHKDSGLRVLYRELKTSNILLDSEMNPKISDFGFARILEERQSESEITQVVGTIGYMSPEYSTGNFSVKSDVYSFGIIVLEIISGRRMHESYSESMPTLLSYAWKLWNVWKALNLVDESLGGAFSTDEASSWSAMHSNGTKSQADYALCG
ncbi:cysteine-rich receptor-like protein kinase 25, partial [Phtheirospermum japonicum]